MAGDFPNNADTIVSMLGAFAMSDVSSKNIHWSLYAGMPDEALVRGSFSEVASEIERTRHKPLLGGGWNVSGLHEKKAFRQSGLSE